MHCDSDAKYFLIFIKLEKDSSATLSNPIFLTFKFELLVFFAFLATNKIIIHMHAHEHKNMQV